MFLFTAILGLILIQFVPLPKWKFLGSLCAISSIIVGLDIIAICYDSPRPGAEAFAGITVGVGLGYFLKWFRTSLRVTNSGKPSKPATNIAEKLKQLGGHLAEPAIPDEIRSTEQRLCVSLPTELRDFLLQHNGTTRESDKAMWSFWSCSEITSYSKYVKEEDYFRPCLNENESPTELRSERLILFADAMIHAPIYAVYLSPGETFHGTVFELLGQTVSAKSFSEWTNLFLARAEDAVLND